MAFYGHVQVVCVWRVNLFRKLLDSDAAPFVSIALVVLLPLSLLAFAPPSEVQEWEYLVLSPVKTNAYEVFETQMPATYKYSNDVRPYDGDLRTPRFVDFNEHLDALGAAGWELVDVSPRGDTHQYTLKRPKKP